MSVSVSGTLWSKIWLRSTSFKRILFRCWAPKQDWNFRTFSPVYRAMSWSASKREFWFRSMQTGIQPCGIGSAKRGRSRPVDTWISNRLVVSCNTWIFQDKHLRTISTALGMTWVNGFKVHRNGCGEAESQQSDFDIWSDACSSPLQRQQRTLIRPDAVVEACLLTKLKSRLLLG